MNKSHGFISAVVIALAFTISACEAPVDLTTPIASIQYAHLGPTFVVLDPSNSFTDVLETGATIGRENTNAGVGGILGNNVEFSCDVCSAATFADAADRIGGRDGSFCGYANRVPREIVANDDRLCARSTISTAMWDIDLLSFRSVGRCLENPTGSCASAGGYTSYIRSLFDESGHDPTDRDECKNGGWEASGFKNQGQCVRFVETGKDSR